LGAQKVKDGGGMKYNLIEYGFSPEDIAILQEIKKIRKSES